MVEAAERTLHNLEAGGVQNVSGGGAPEMQLSLFQLDDPTLSSIRDQLSQADLNNMTPLQAFDLLRHLKAELGVNK